MTHAAKLPYFQHIEKLDRSFDRALNQLRILQKERPAKAPEQTAPVAESEPVTIRPAAPRPTAKQSEPPPGCVPKAS
jgi:hypothetical protein